MGKKISHYRLEEELGRGGAGHVYKAYDTTLDRTIVLKLLAPDLTADKESRTRFLREARLASALDHPNICTIYEIGEADDQYFIAMQYVPGKTLKQFIGGRPLSLESLLSISLQVGDALAAAHAQGIVHRDIKSTNIIITPRGQAKVLDFGLAKLLSEQPGGFRVDPADVELTRVGASLGTPSYMSPEQARGERVDHRSDIFSFGVVLYEMAAGEGPFKRKSQVETMNAVINEPHAPVTELNKDIPAALAAVMDRALAKRPDDRYPSMPPLMQELRAVVQANWSGELSIPGGVSIPYVPPQRSLSFGSVGRWLGRLWGRETSRTAPPGRTVISQQRESSQISDLKTLNEESASESVMRAAAKMKPGPSIAVLPFVNMSADAENEYFCDGMVEELIDALTKVAGLWVASRSSAFQFKGEAHDIRKVGEQLNVSHVLEGSVRKAGTRLRITAQLIKADDGYHLWSEKYDRELEDIFAIQEEITGKIVQQLKIKLAGEPGAPRVKLYTQNIDAYTLYLKGRFYWNQRTEEGIKKGIEHFQQAIDTDSNYAVAYAGVADCYNILVITGADPPQECWQKAKSAATKALEIDDELAEAHASLALVRMYYEWDWLEAEREFKRAIGLNPNYPTAHQWYAEYLAAMSRPDEAVAEIKRAQELDPLSVMVVTAVGIIFYYARQYDQAIGPLRKAIEMNPNFPPAHRVLGWVCEQQGLSEETIAAFQNAVTTSGRNVSMLADLGRADGLSGEKGEAQKGLDELKSLAQHRYVSPYELALIYTGMGERDQALEKLEEACQEHYWSVAYLNVHPVWDGLRSDPRFTELVKKMGLERS
jgi:serine/threonine-protein kinase